MEFAVKLRILTAMAAVMTPLAAHTAPDPRDVYTLPVTVAPMPLNLSMTGTIAATQTTTAAFGTGGLIIEINVEVGDIVSAGDVLARLDPTQQTEAVRIAEASLTAAEASRTTFAAAFARQQSLLENGNTTRASYDSAYQSMVSATSARDNAQAQLAKARQALSDTIITASSDGIVTARGADIGQVVPAAQSVLSLAGVTGREAIFYAPDSYDLSHIVGKTITLATLDLPGRLFTATLSEVAPNVDPQLGSIRVKASISDTVAAQLSIGDAVIGALYEEVPDFPGHIGITIPWSALSADQSGPAVWLIEAGATQVSLHSVSVISYETATVLLEPTLPQGARVVTVGAQFLFPGQDVRDLGDPPQEP
ncbi:efflux RND transporter periplasmic adaptor subunit [Ketogulonicigenium vulgare]|nr:efflux RND transporter periplasmic adaptor subunit [Ketogulonicigenium vulgare]ANW33012.1 efflux transporter periplasmic adaptor subunit [Ketogulonicigenium vulgare]AOZ53626.1 secretion protein HlyD [Ketogulonicigenium vulgare]